MAMADDDIIRYNMLLETPVEDFLIKADRFTKALKRDIELAEKIKANERKNSLTKP